MAQPSHEANGVADIWLSAFRNSICRFEVSAALKKAALGGRTKDWTSLLTGVVVQSSEIIGWSTAAKGHPLGVLPQSGQEYLSVDAMSFEANSSSGYQVAPVSIWQFPVAVFELENSRKDERVAYSLWKILCIRTKLRVVFAYRKNWQKAKQLVQHLTEAVIAAMPLQDRLSLSGETLLVLGSRGEDETFPHGYFKTWRLERNTGVFEIV